jgi:hypothetical protein
MEDEQCENRSPEEMRESKHMDFSLESKFGLVEVDDNEFNVEVESKAMFDKVYNEQDPFICKSLYFLIYNL